MIDNRIEKIRAEIERRLEDAKAGVRQNQNGVKFEIDNKQDLVIWQHLESMAVQLLSFIDSLQEEPVSIWHDASKKSDNPEDVVIINPSDNTGEVLTKCTGVNQGHIWAYISELLKLDNLCNIGKNLQESQVKESAEIQHVNETCKENGDSLTQESVINVWHDMSEEAENGRNIIIIDPKDFYGAVLRRGGSQLKNHNKERYVKWAYVDELIEL